MYDHDFIVHSFTLLDYKIQNGSSLADTSVSESRVETSKPVSGYAARGNSAQFQPLDLFCE